MRIERWLFAALAAAQVAYGRIPGQRGPGATRALVGLMLAASAAEAVAARGAARGGGGVAAAGTLGFAAELAGVATGRPFGHYAYSGKLGPRVGGVPLLAAAAWAMMARPAWVVAGLLSHRRAARIALAAGALTAWDVFLDPRMAREGYWTWARGGRYEGIPASNFLGWFVTGAGVFAVWSADRRRRRSRPRRRRGAGAVRLDVGRRDVRQRRAVAAAAGRGGGRRRRWAPSRRPRCGGDGAGSRRRRRRRRARGGRAARRARAPRHRVRGRARRGRQVRAGRRATASRGTRARRC